MVQYRDLVEQANKDPELRKLGEAWARVTPPKRKVPLYLDRNLPDDLVEELRELNDVFKLAGIAGPGDSDEAVYRAAIDTGALLITCDMDFWDDGRFPLHDSPGVVIAKGRTAEELSHAIALFIVAVDAVDSMKRVPGWFGRMKYKVSRAGYVEKMLTHDSRKLVEQVAY